MSFSPVRNWTTIRRSFGWYLGTIRSASSSLPDGWYLRTGNRFRLWCYKLWHDVFFLVKGYQTFEEACTHHLHLNTEAVCFSGILVSTGQSTTLCRNIGYSTTVLTWLAPRTLMIVFWRSGDSASWKILIIKPTRCTNFSNSFFGKKTTCFGQFLYPSSGGFHSTHNNGVCHTGLLTAC